MISTADLKDDLHQIIDQIEDQATLQAVHILLAPQVGTFYNLEGKRLDQDSIEDLLEESEADIEAGRIVSQKALETQIQSWRNQNSAK